MIGRLHILVDTPELARQALLGGANCLQIRIKGGDDGPRLAASQQIVDLCNEANADCFVNDRADIAMAIGAQGVHLGSNDLPVSAVRHAFGPDIVIGGTARNAGAALSLQSQGASYVGVGPVYATRSKTGLPDPIGLDTLRSVVDALDIPVIAIGGIDLERLPDVLATGVHGIAVIGAVAGASDPTVATKSLLDAMSAHR